MTLDIRAFWLIGALATTSFGVLILIVRRAYPASLNKSLAYFGIANLCLGASYDLRLAHGFLGDFFFYGVSATLVNLCLILEYFSVCLLKRTRPSLSLVFGPPVFVFMSSVIFIRIHRDISVGLILCNAADFVMMVLIAYRLFQKEDGRRSFADVVTASLFSLLALSTFAVIADSARRFRIPADYNFNYPRSIFSNTVDILAEGIIFPLFILMLSERLNRRLVLQALHDPLTNIYNRRAFEDIAFRELSGATRRECHLALLVVDLDHFKEVNDRFGHSAGDALLRAASGVLRRSLRDEDYLCRWGGDEFCALLTRAGKIQAEAVARRILDAFAEFKFPQGADVIEVTASIGIAVHTGREKNLAPLFTRADLALYRAKVDGRNRFVFAPDLADSIAMNPDFVSGIDKIASPPPDDLTSNTA